MARLRNQRGFSILGGLILTVAIVGVGFVVVRFVNQLGFLSSVADRRAIGDAYLVSRIAELEAEGYPGIAPLCAQKTLACVVSGALTSASIPPVKTPQGISLNLGTRVNAEGKVDAQGEYCLQVQDCSESAQRDLIQLQLRLYFKDPDSGNRINSLDRYIRRSR